MMTIWHSAPLAQQLISDMFALTAMYDRYVTFARASGDRYPEHDETARAAGYIAPIGGFRTPYRWEAYGLAGKLVDRLEGIRDEWMEAEHKRRCSAAGLHLHSDGADDIFEEIEAATDSTDAAINAWIRSHQKEAA